MVKIHTDKNVADLLTKAFDFWATVKTKTINGEVQLQALVDGKKIIITESIVRRDHQLEDVEGIDCLPNATIFEQLSLMGAKTTAWNEFSSTMASTIICLATNHKFNFSKFIFESMVKNLENVSGKFLMYPSGPTTKVADEAVNEEMDDRLERAATIATSLDAEQDMGAKTPWGIPLLKLDLRMYLNIPIIHCSQEVTHFEVEITSLKLRVKKLEKKGGSRTYKLKRIYKVGKSARVISSDEAILGDQEDASKQGRKINNIDKDAEITLVHETQGRYGDEEIFDTCILDGDDVLAEPEVTVKNMNLSVDEVTLAQALAALKSAKQESNTVAAMREAQLNKETNNQLYAPKREIQCPTYQKYMAWIQAQSVRNDIKLDDIQKLFDKAMKRVNTFVDMDTELVEDSKIRTEGSETRVEGSSKKAGEELEQESSKKQKLEEDKETPTNYNDYSPLQCHGDEGGGESWRSLRCLFSLYMAVFGQPTSVPGLLYKNLEITAIYYRLENPWFLISYSRTRANSMKMIWNNGLEVAALSTKNESVSTVTRWDTLQGNVEHQGTKRVSSDIKTTLGSKETMKTHLQENEVLFSEEVAVLKREVACKDYEINVLKSEFEKVKQEKEDPEFKSYGSKDSKLESNIVCDKKSDDSKENSDDSLVKEQVSEDTSSFVESPLNVDKETVFLVDKKIEFVKPKNHEKPVKKSVRYAEMYRSQSPRGNQRNRNGQKSNQLGSDFVMYNKACFICGSFDHVQINYNYHQRERMVSRNNYNRVDYDYYAKTTHPSAHMNMTPRAVLLKTGLTPLNTVRPVNTAHPKPAVYSAKSMSHFFKQAQLTDQRPFYKKTTLTSRYVNQQLNTAMRHYHNERPKAVNTARSCTAPVNAVRAKRVNSVKTSACWVWRPTRPNGASLVFKRHNYIDARGRSNGCLRHMTGNIAYLSDFKEFDGGYVTFRGGAHGGRISSKGTLKTDSLDFEDVYFVNELNFNLFSVSQMCDKKNYFLFTDTQYLVLSPNFKLPDESQILLKIPRKDNMYSFDMKNIVPKESLTCLVAKDTLDESMLWHRRFGHINFKNINKLVKDNLVRGLPTKRFKNDQTCVACLKGKQHRASCKSKVLNPITKPLFMLHIDLFGPTFVSSLMHKKYCLVVTDDYSRTPQQNDVAERRNRTLIEAARTMLADSKLPTTFWAKSVSTACYVQNKILVVKPHNKTPYELFRGLKPDLNFMRPFRCHVTILNTLDNLGKFGGKSDAGFFVGYSLSSKAFRVYNTRTRRVEENLHIGFLKNKPLIEGNGPKWLFDIDSLTQSMNYVPVVSGTISNEFAGTISNESAGTQEKLNAGTSTQKEKIIQDCVMMPIWKDASYFDLPSKDVGNGEPKSASDDQKQAEDGSHNESDEKDKSKDDSSPKEVNVAGQHVNTASLKVNTVDPSVNTASSNDQDSPKDMFKLGASHTLEATHVEFFSDEDEPEVDLGNITNSYTIPTTPNTRIHKDHPIKNVIGDVKSTIQTRRMTKSTSEQGFLSAVYEQKTHDTLNTCLYACFLSQIEPTSIAKALSDSSWMEAMQEELLQFKLQ
ncbi:putative ribonuclease H-like domain-containing protein [Tanacetum coccineum]|uniref:Ribonuclease H-like domain-containing protein n=1 Tax=Tanacetum coccineum TaxID=301880 RepID=A0ABQ5J506_9ASTR